MSKGKQRISKIAKDLLTNHKDYNYLDNVCYGDLDILHEIFEIAGLKVKISHPLNKHQAVLNALDRESKQENAIFIKEYFRSYIKDWEECLL